MRRAWWTAAVAVVALVLAVVLVRPGSQASPDDVAAPPAAADTQRLRPDVLAVLGLADLPVTADGIGPLRLGDDLAVVVAAGWPTEAVGDCVRLLPQELTDATLSGWVVNGRVVSAQVEAVTATVEEVVSDVGFSFGVPVSEVATPQDLTVRTVGEDPGVEVSVARLATGSGSVLVSDVGTAGIRFAEVATGAGEACELDTSLLASTAFPGVESRLDRVVLRAEATDVGLAYPWQLGSTVEQVAADLSPAALSGVSGTGCEELTWTTADGDDIRLSVLDGSVVGQQVELDTGSMPGPTVGEAFEPTATGTLARTEQVDVEVRDSSGWASNFRATLLARTELVPELDTLVVSQGPVVRRQEIGEPC